LYALVLLNVCTISPSPQDPTTSSQALPPITEAVTINGYTQRLCSKPNTRPVGNDAVLLIQLNAANASGSAGLYITASNGVVKGFVINRFLYGIGIDSATGNTIEGNFIGTNAAGTVDVGNRTSGVSVLGIGSNNTVGGTSPAACNLISANGQRPRTGDNGVVISGSGNRVLDNYIGTDRTGTESLGNGDSGVTFYTAGPNAVGGNTAASANVIAFNGHDGVTIYNPGSTANSILRNSIFSNAEFGIDLGDGRTTNDAGDTDDGPNNLQNFPRITPAETLGDTTTIKGQLNSTPSTTFEVRFFSNPSNDNEGKRFIGKMSVDTDENGNTDTFTFSPANTVAQGQKITATATDPGGNTSEFSAPREVTGDHR